MEHQPITCLCPTYGRFRKLRRALACFLAQDYPGERRLLVLNDAPMPLLIPAACSLLTAVNRPSPFGNLGEKRQWLLEAADSPLVAHWDDDDIYLPWHLREMVEALGRGIECTKVRCAWVLEEDPVRITGRHCSGNDASMVFSRETALALGGYPRQQVGQNIGLLRAFQDGGRYAPVEQGEVLSFVRSGRPRSPGHNQAMGDFHAANRDFGDGEPLAPADLRPVWKAILAAVRGPMSDGALYRLKAGLGLVEVSHA